MFRPTSPAAYASLSAAAIRSCASAISPRT